MTQEFRRIVRTQRLLKELRVANVSQALAELALRREQMARFPFCPDHRDKVHRLPCRECEIERLRSVIRRVAGQTSDAWAHEMLIENLHPESSNT